VAWVAGALAYSYPAIKEEIEEKGYLAQTQRAGTPVIPVDCDRAHGIENRDFIREDKNPDQCWMDLANSGGSIPTSPRPWTSAPPRAS
jgi:hypothetical protein